MWNSQLVRIAVRPYRSHNIRDLVKGLSICASSFESRFHTKNPNSQIGKSITAATYLMCAGKSQLSNTFTNGKIQGEMKDISIVCQFSQ